MNIKLSADKFKGECPVSYDPDFKQFRTLRDGLRAAFAILRTYILHRACNTVRAIVERWCGEKGSVLANYLSTVCKRTGLFEDTRVRWIDKAVLVAIVAAMIFFENGKSVSEHVLSDAYDAV